MNEIGLKLWFTIKIHVSIVINFMLIHLITKFFIIMFIIFAGQSSLLHSTFPRILKLIAIGSWEIILTSD